METRYYITGDSAESIEDAKKVTVAQALNDFNKRLLPLESLDINNALSQLNTNSAAIAENAGAIAENAGAIAENIININKLKGTVIFSDENGSGIITGISLDPNKTYELIFSSRCIKKNVEDVEIITYQGKASFFFKPMPSIDFSGAAFTMGIFPSSYNDQTVTPSTNIIVNNCLYITSQLNYITILEFTLQSPGVGRAIAYKLIEYSEV